MASAQGRETVSAPVRVVPVQVVPVQVVPVQVVPAKVAQVRGEEGRGRVRAPAAPVVAAARARAVLHVD